jgi:hypothetical protein
MTPVNRQTARLPKQIALRFNWFNPAFWRKLRHEEKQARPPHPHETAGRRPNLAHGGTESEGGVSRQTARALQTRQAQRRQNPQFRRRHKHHREISEKKQSCADQGLIEVREIGDPCFSEKIIVARRILHPTRDKSGFSPDCFS